MRAGRVHPRIYAFTIKVYHSLPKKHKKCLIVRERCRNTEFHGIVAATCCMANTVCCAIIIIIIITCSIQESVHTDWRRYRTTNCRQSIQTATVLPSYHCESDSLRHKVLAPDSEPQTQPDTPVRWMRAVAPWRCAGTETHSFLVRL